MSLYRPSSAGYEGSVFLTTMSQNKQAPKWSFAGRYGLANSRPLTPGPGTYGADSRSQRQPGYGFGSCARDQGLLSMASPGPGAYGASESYGSKRPHSAGPAFGRARRGLGNGGGTPGPGAYVPNVNSTRPQFPRHTCTPRRDGSVVRRRCSTPGPGTYGDLCGGRGESPLSSAPRWGFGTSNRGIRANGQNPGPGQYDLREVGAFAQESPQVMPGLAAAKEVAAAEVSNGMHKWIVHARARLPEADIISTSSYQPCASLQAFLLGSESVALARMEQAQSHPEEDDFSQFLSQENAAPPAQPEVTAEALLRVVAESSQRQEQLLGKVCSLLVSLDEKLGRIASAQERLEDSLHRAADAPAGAARAPVSGQVQRGALVAPPGKPGYSAAGAQQGPSPEEQRLQQERLAAERLRMEEENRRRAEEMNRRREEEERRKREEEERRRQEEERRREEERLRKEELGKKTSGLMSGLLSSDSGGGGGGLHGAQRV
ncbi:unnamed protein product [Symbiodinium sp. CCMP2592]|nr:unnamed protein product [Symbiodinium sp. CCMP2592]